MQRITITPSQIQDRQISLTVEQHHYLTRVIRLHSGSQFQAIDGTGQLYLAEITAGNAQILQISSTIDREFSQPITLICALPKGNNFDDLVRACTELGVTSIFPAISDRTLLNPSPQKLLRWRKIAQEATEQSERIVCPIIAEPQPLKTIFSQMTDCNSKYLCHSRGDRPHLLTCLQSRQLANSPITIAIGPEGGWTDAEIEMAIEYKFQLVSLGRHILRTITAPIVALSIVTATIEGV
ncbi:16S rRNA (uracil(1498)-N(3))-methyltransferase [Chamaesiphon sp. VAR_48_metabat_135_sub]|uniref:16S rRNA (uracil(1498)-N(3))-methyltransferase n=1 Tax=Chamaesiphon sp. VAR_48_metabat_135_sub TaxID=2964699 RepID=UPI00286CCC00|nr:16S rRNA (uracil(1498)-N(3))-methyltransferase [Chamaesiphon sp. VAR_48_metabat_135_sub]